MKNIKVLAVFFALCFSFFVVSFFALTSIDSNPQDQYCSVIGYVVDVPGQPERTYIKKAGEFVKYDPLTHQDKKLFYIKASSSVYEFDDANWVSQGRVCKLENQAYWLIASTFGISFLLSFIFLFLLFVMFYAAFQSLKKDD